MIGSGVLGVFIIRLCLIGRPSVGEYSSSTGCVTSLVPLSFCSGVYLASWRDKSLAFPIRQWLSPTLSNFYVKLPTLGPLFLVDKCRGWPAPGTQSLSQKTKCEHPSMTSLPPYPWGARERASLQLNSFFMLGDRTDCSYAKARIPEIGIDS